MVADQAGLVEPSGKEELHERRLGVVRRQLDDDGGVRGLKDAAVVAAAELVGVERDRALGVERAASATLAWRDDGRRARLEERPRARERLVHPGGVRQAHQAALSMIRPSFW